jgi:hypothetical protein
MSVHDGSIEESELDMIHLYLSSRKFNFAKLIIFSSSHDLNSQKFKILLVHGVMVSVVASSEVDHGFEPRSGQTKDYEIGICSSR